MQIYNFFIYCTNLSIHYSASVVPPTESAGTLQQGRGNLRYTERERGERLFELGSQYVKELF